MVEACLDKDQLAAGHVATGALVESRLLVGRHV